MSTTFGAPMDDAEEAMHADGVVVPDEVQETLDMNDPRLVSEELQADPTADAYAQPIPPPDGNWRVKLKISKQKDAQNQEVDYIPKLWGKDKKAVYKTGVEASIIDPAGKFDGLKAYDFNVSTAVQERTKSTKVMTILGKLKRPDGEPWVKPTDRTTPRVWIDLLVKALAGEPEVGITSEWEYSCQACGEEAKKKGESYPRSVRGMHKFPSEPDPMKRKAGQMFSAEMKCPVNPAHGYGRARVNIVRFLSLEELKQVSGK